jgi:hypothetical protein
VGTAAVADRQDSVFFLGSSGEVFHRIETGPAAHICSSQNGTYLGIQQILEREGPSERPKSISLTLYHFRGEKLWSITDPLGVDEPLPSWYISNSGRVVVVSPTTSRLRFFDRSGSVERTVELFSDSPPEMERPIACAFSEDGQWLAVNALYHHPRPGDAMTPRQRGQSYLILFAEGGDELWRRPLEEEISGPVAISGQGQTIAATAVSIKGVDLIEVRTHLYDAQGCWLAAVDMAFRLADFGASGDRLLLSRKGDLRVVETATGKILWEDRLADEYGQIRAVDLSPDGTSALAMAAPSHYRNGRFHFTPVHAAVYDERGRQVWSQSFPEAISNRPLAGFLSDGNGFMLSFRNRYLIYEQVR